MTSFLMAHFVRFMDAYKDGRLNTVTAEDFRFNLNAATNDEQVATVYCLANDLDDEEWVPKLVEGYRKLREKTPRPIPDSVVLGDN